MKSEQTKQLSKKLCSSRLVSKRAREANERFRREGEENWSVLLFALGPFTSLHRSRWGKSTLRYTRLCCRKGWKNTTNIQTWTTWCSSFWLHALIFQLFLIADPPEFPTPPQIQQIREGSNVTLTCNATGNPQPTTFSWSRSGSAVNTSVNPRISLSSNNKELTITNVSRKDSGEYRCEASNSVGKPASKVNTTGCTM